MSRPITCDCMCRGVDMGSHDAMVVVHPFKQEAASGFGGSARFGRTQIGVDACLVPALFALWESGFRTLASCCGHGQRPPTVCVHPEDAPRMAVFGFERDTSIEDENVHAFLIPGAGELATKQCDAWRKAAEECKRLVPPGYENVKTGRRMRAALKAARELQGDG